MPRADTALTAHRWATERAVDLWAFFSADLGAREASVLAATFAAIRADGGRLALVVPPGHEPDLSRPAVDLVVAAPNAPSPFGLFRALEAAGVGDARRLGVVGMSANALEAGHRAGAGAIVGLAGSGTARRALLAGQPDAIVDIAEFAAHDAVHYASARAHRERVLLNPGPSVVSDRVHRAVGGPDLCHREPEYTEIFRRVRQDLLRAAGVGDDWAVVLLAGSGTAAMEAMTGAGARPGRKLLVCRNGIYGERIETIARRLGQEVTIVDAPVTVPIDPAAVAAALAADPTIDAVAVIHHETTTGLLNPVREIAAVADAHGVLTQVDAISSLGAEDLELPGSGIDFVACTSNKCLHGLPGAAFVLVSPRGQARAAAVPPRSLYFDMPNYLRAQEKGTVPFTPAIPAIYGLAAALDELFDEGLERRREHYRERMAYLDAEFDRLGLELLVAPEHRSRSVRSLRLPDGLAYETLHDALKADGYVIYAGLGDALKTTFRVCALGDLDVGALEGFVASLERVLAQRPAVANVR
ncbi:MAG TPA: aminotransferase class V-fold PLP-dependent enzyme [Candidatus Limnocylindria bacterium]|nr:aminotransferase class V-fold PLP-dependent enzyme [Candidatus Limnocylindria bacterium]